MGKGSKQTFPQGRYAMTHFISCQGVVDVSLDEIPKVKLVRVWGNGNLDG